MNRVRNMSNYPDDIRDFDNDPGSPFYEGNACCDECGEELEVTGLDEYGDAETACLNDECEKP